ncbi:MAG: nucleotidyltransferase domain-containing protein [Deltaproteobacteria bacterium]|nr:nucleotidyltransferase domain-containing protein [Nannocystaceae bacterium]
MPHQVPAPVLERIRATLERGPPLRFAILFGSQARGTARPDSDFDIAIAPARALTLAEENALAMELERTLGAAVDLVDVAAARPALRWRIARDGIVLSSSPTTAAARFLAQSGIEHDELAELERDAMRRFRARLAAPGGGR